MLGPKEPCCPEAPVHLVSIFHVLDSQILFHLCDSLYFLCISITALLGGACELKKKFTTKWLLHCNLCVWQKRTWTYNAPCNSTHTLYSSGFLIPLVRFGVWKQTLLHVIIEGPELVIIWRDHRWDPRPCSSKPAPL